MCYGYPPPPPPPPQHGGNIQMQQIGGGVLTQGLQSYATRMAGTSEGDLENPLIMLFTDPWRPFARKIRRYHWTSNEIEYDKHGEPTDDSLGYAVINAGSYAVLGCAQIPFVAFLVLLGMNGWEFKGQEVLLSFLIILYVTLGFACEKAKPSREERIKCKLEVILPFVMSRRQAMRT
jgi:hypothetical protein